MRGRLGRFDEARAAGERSVAIARAQSDRRVGGCGEIYLSVIALMDARPLDAETLARAALQTLADIPPLVPAALAALARALLVQNRRDEALASATSAHDLLESAGWVEDGESLIRLVYAECLLAAGSAARATDALHRAVHRLDERASAIEKPEWRAAFLNLPDHARTLELAASTPPRSAWPSARTIASSTSSISSTISVLVNRRHADPAFGQVGGPPLVTDIPSTS